MSLESCHWCQAGFVFGPIHPGMVFHRCDSGWRMAHALCELAQRYNTYAGSHEANRKRGAPAGGCFLALGPACCSCRATVWSWWTHLNVVLGRVCALSRRVPKSGSTCWRLACRTEEECCGFVHAWLSHGAVFGVNPERGYATLAQPAPSCVTECSRAGHQDESFRRIWKS